MRIIIEVQGTSPLLMNRFTEENEIAVSSGVSQSVNATGKTPRDLATPKLYVDKDTGVLQVPGTAIFGTIINAGAFHKIGKKQVTTQKSSLVPAGIQVEELVCSLGTKDWEVDSRSVVNPATRGRRMCHRPRLDKWSLTFTLLVDETMFGPDLVRAIVDDAGKKVGLLDYSPRHRGPFGKFVVVKWKVEKDKLARVA